MAAAALNPASSVLLDPGVAHAVLQWCRNPGGGRQHIEEVSTAERKAIKTLVHLHLAGWRELQAAFQDAEKHWKQLEEQQVATRQMVRSLLAEQQPSMCAGAGAPLAPPLKPPVPAPRRTGALLLSPPLPALRTLRACHPSLPVPALRRFRAPLLSLLRLMHHVLHIRTAEQPPTDTYVIANNGEGNTENNRMSTGPQEE
ncbi:hypothetical protein MHYP_G00297210 [Metynnis hypsauchen]